jgi:hypothetical protein
MVVVMVAPVASAVAPVVVPAAMVAAPTTMMAAPAAIVSAVLVMVVPPPAIAPVVIVVVVVMDGNEGGLRRDARERHRLDAGGAETGREGETGGGEATAVQPRLETKSHGGLQNSDGSRTPRPSQANLDHGG